MSPLIPDKDNHQEEPLKYMFERNKEYLQSKKTAINKYLQNNFEKLSNWEKLTKFLHHHRILLLGLSTSGITALLILTLFVGPRLNFIDLSSGLKGILGTLEVSAKDIDITPTSQDATGVKTDSEFLIRSQKDLTSKQIQDNLKITPAVKYQLEYINSKEFKLKIQDNLDQKQVYKFELTTKNTDSDLGESKPLTWAFAISNDFRVAGSLPRDKTVDVPTNTGIEINFNYQNYKDFEKFFEISPQVDGKFEKHGKIMVFAPKELSKATLYRVTVKKGLPLENSDKILDSDYQFQFETTSEGATNSLDYIGFSKDFNEFTANENPIIKLSSPNSTQDLNLNIYNLGSSENYTKLLEERLALPYWSIYAKDKFSFDTKNLNKIKTFKAAVQKIGSDDNLGEKYITMPDKLSDGYYLMEAQTNIPDKPKIQTLIQVTDLAAYTQESNNKILFWTMDLTNAKPITDAKIQFEPNGQSYSTEGQGIAQLDTPSQNIKYFNITSGNKKLILPRGSFDNLYFNSNSVNNNLENYTSSYWSYIYKDKTIYKPTDTINLWGFIKPRLENNSPALKASLIKFNYAANNSQKIIIQSKNLKLNNNTFIDKFDVKNLESGGYNLEITDQSNQIIQNSYIDIQTYTKPAYKIDLKADKPAYFTGEIAKVQGQVSFFEGTPVPNTELSYYFGSKVGDIKTDKDGKFGIDLAIDKNSNSQYSEDYLSVAPKLAEQGNIEGTLYIKKFNSHIYVGSETEKSLSTSKLKIDLSEVDISKIEDTDFYPDLNKIKDNKIKNKDLTITVTPHGYNKIEDGQYYDFIGKTTQKNYRYVEYFDSPQVFNLKTDQDGLANLELKTSQEKQYAVAVQLTGDNNQQITVETNVYDPYSSQPNGSVNIVSNAPKNKYQTNDDIDLSFKRDGENLANQNGNQYLLTFNQDGLKKYQLQDSSNFQFKFEEGFAPNIMIEGVYFNGKRFVKPVGQIMLTYDYKQKDLKVSIASDKQVYKPGEVVNLNIETKNYQGQPTKAQVNLSLVDEAIYKIAPNDNSILDNLYKLVPAGIKYIYGSHTESNINNQPGAGAGGGGGRSEFPDTALFKEISTDDQGKAQISFKLPDNLTSWRLSYVAANSNLEAGSGYSNIVTKQDFFALATLNEVYLENDKPVIKLKAFGQKLENDSEVKFQIDSQTLNINKEVVTKASAAAEIDLGNLKPGKHKITIKAGAKGLEDTIVYEINVLSSYLQKKEVKFIKYTENSQIPISSNQNTTLTFSNEGFGKYYGRLQELYQTYGNRLDQKLAKQISSELLRSEFKENLPSESFDLNTHQASQKGGLSLLPYSDSDLELTVSAVSLAPESFGKVNLINYLESVLNSTKGSREQKITAMYGLASLGENQLVNINQILQLQDLTLKEKLLLGLSSFKSEDKAQAFKIYREIIEKNTENVNGYLKVNIGEDDNAKIKNTLLVANLSILLQEKEADQLYDFVINNYPQGELLYLNELSFIQNRLKYSSQDEVEFQLNHDNQKIVKKIVKNELYSIEVNKDTLGKLDLKVNSGKLGIISSYQSTFLPNKDIRAADLEIKRNYSVNGQNTNKFRDGDLVKVTLDYNIKNDQGGCYEINDYLPSGLKPLIQIMNSPYSKDADLVYPYGIDNQRVSFCAFKDNQKPISYLAKVITKGDYKAESPTIQSSKNPNLINYQESTTIKID